VALTEFQDGGALPSRRYALSTRARTQQLARRFLQRPRIFFRRFVATSTSSTPPARIRGSPIREKIQTAKYTKYTNGTNLPFRFSCGSCISRLKILRTLASRPPLTEPNAFLQRHQDKLVYGSDCSDLERHGEKCQGAQTIAAVRRFASSKKIERKRLYGNAKKLFRL
jgi:hypothetical protein